MNLTFSLLLPRDEISVPVVRRITGSALLDLGVERGCLEDIELALTEACSNVLRHADGAVDEYEVTLEISESDCIVRVVDAGGGFDHEIVGHALAHEEAETGRGVQLMRSLVDKVNFVSKPESGTVVRLEKKLGYTDSSILKRLAAATTS